MKQRIIALAFLLCGIYVPAIATAEKSTARDTVITGKHFTYEGEWPEGKGVLSSYKYGLVFGTFKEGVPVGTCLTYGPNDKIYWGPYVDGKRTGYACMSKKKGAILVRGEFVDGRQHGIDTVYREDGTVIVGRYEKNKFIETIAEYNHIIPKDIRKAIPKFPKIKLSKSHKKFLEDYREKYRDHQKKMRAERAGQNNGEIKPLFNGSPNGFSEWVNERLVYPAQARKNKVEGCTVLKFTITAEGKMTDLKVTRSSGSSLLDMEAIRVVSESPDWTPGMLDGKAVDMPVVFPVIFKLNRF